MALVNVPSWRGKKYLELSAFRLGLSPASEMDDHKMYYDVKDPLAAAGGRRLPAEPHHLLFAQARAQHLRGLQGRALKGLPEGLERFFRRSSDWVDLQWSELESVLRALAPRARGRLLDVGCADKPYEAWFRPYVTSYIGIEYAATFGATAAGGRGGPDLVYSGGRLPFRDGAFDTVLSVQVLEHTPDPGALIGEMSRVLAPDGVLILSAPFQFKLHEQPHDYFRYSPHGLRTLCEAADLESSRRPRRGASGPCSARRSTATSRSAWRGSASSRRRWGSWGTKSRSARSPAGGRCRWSAPGIVSIAAAARLMDRFFPETDESLGFTILAQRRRPRQLS